MSKKNSTEALLTSVDFENVFDNPFASNDKERLKYMKLNYGRMGIAKSFGIFYNTEVNQDIKSNRSINTVVNIELGKIYTGTVKEFLPNGTIVFDIPGVKEELVSKENFNSCRDTIENYLITHDNKLLFEARESKPGKFVVSVINAYYRNWQDQIKKSIQIEEGIQVHIDSLTKGGYLCHTSIWTLKELTGKEYTSSVFIPGSHIVLNIERDFEKWIGQDVIIIPQKFVEFRKDMYTGLIENSLVGSRKKVLQIMGIKNTYNIYNDIETAKKLNELSSKNIVIKSDRFTGTVTGIIDSNKKTGAFVELTDKYITGLLPLDANVLLDYRPGDIVDVRIKEWECQEGKEPFVFNKKKQPVRSNVRPVFELA